MTKEINFYPSSEELEDILETPIPAIKAIPSWYKDMPSQMTKPNLAFDNSPPMMGEYESRRTIKKCMPFLDTLSSGYIIVLDADLVVNPDDPSFQYNFVWPTDYDLIGNHNIKQIGNMDVPKGFSRQPLKWLSYWIIKTPPGYSSLFIHPLGYYDLPFITISGIVDTDKYNSPVNLPFFIKEDFTGIIPKGTPIAQIIPIKRDRWKLKINKFNINFFKESKRMIKSLEKVYKKNYWSRKEYK